LFFGRIAVLSRTNILRDAEEFAVKVQSKPVKVHSKNGMVQSKPAKTQPKPKTDIDDRLESAIVELLALQEVLSSDEVDNRILSDFRDALNRVRNTAWAAQKYVSSREFGEGTAGLGSFLAGERVRCAFQLCRSIDEDLKREEVEFQKGQLAQLQGAIAGLSKQLQQKL
jgi:hypothetical protein